MVKMVSLRKSAADKRAEKDSLGVPASPADDGGDLRVHLDHHHLTKLGVGGGLKSGHKVSFSGEGTVESSSTRSENGEDRHSATLRLNKGGVEHEGDMERDAEERAGLRNEIEKIHGKSEESAEKRREAAGARRAAKGEKV